MADAKGAKPLFDKTHLQHTMLMLITLLILGAIASQFFLYLNEFDTTILGSLWARLLAWFLRYWPTWKVIVIILTLVCVPWIIYNTLKLRQISEEEKKIYGHQVIASSGSGVEPVKKGNEKWLRVVAHVNSANPSDWRLAIIEADIMLDELLRSKGYQGDGVGEMLKSVDPTDILTLDVAWEAHKVRNRIAHSGADFQLNERETKRVITLFEAVFKEAEII